MKIEPYDPPLVRPKDKRGDLNISDWGYTIVVLIVMFILIAALMPTLATALTDYNATEPIIGTILETLVPILIGLALLLLVVATLLKKSGSKGGGI